LILIDCHNIVYRVAYTHHGLSHNGSPTGVIFGFLKQVITLMDRYPGEICFCWDSPRSLRKEFYPEYKGNRNKDEPPPEVVDAHGQMTLLRDDLLPRIGLQNQMFQDGYEADDLIGALTRTPGKHIIVSSDHDLYQLLGPSTVIHRPGKNDIYHHGHFMTEYNIAPSMWIEAKALAGDPSDNIEGLKGVGIKTAIKLLTGRGSNKLIQKVRDNEHVVIRNRKLVTVPWEGCDPGDVLESKLDKGELRAVCSQYGMRNLI
jgi:DNA polymerase-1